MSYRNKTYVVFDAGDGKPTSKDMCYYRVMQAWKKNEEIEFDFHDAHDLNNITDKASEDQIKKKLRERLANTKALIVIAGERTKNLYKFVRWEIEIAIDLQMPIIVTYVDGSRNLNKNLCPPLLVGKNALHVDFKAKIIKYAMDNYPGSFEKKDLDEENDWIYNDEIYKKLGL